MRVTLYRNNSPPDYWSKSIVQLWQGEGTLREPCDVLNPAILIEGDLSSILNRCNYMFIDDFSRYYYVTGMVVTGYTLYSVSGTVDALMSWKDFALANTAVVSRQENLYNLYLDDGVFKAYSNPVVQRLNFSGGFTTSEFILAVAGGLAT